MFLSIGHKPRGGYTRTGEQWAHGEYLLFMTCEREKDFAALIRYAYLHQLGHFMMGHMRVGPYRLGLSGTFGGDGLPRDVVESVFDTGLIVPAEIRAAWNAEKVKPIVDWAADNYSTLRRPYRK